MGASDCRDAAVPYYGGKSVLAKLYRSTRTPPEYLANEFCAHTNLRQLALPEANYYPLNPVPVVRLDDSGARELVECEWGLLPFFWRPSNNRMKRSGFQRKCFNARSEEVEKTRSYRTAFKSRRCLLPGVEFFEKGHYFHLPERQPFAFAGLWERWRDAEIDVFSCTMLTTEPNAEVRAVGQLLALLPYSPIRR